jgi:hypothetical protein
MQLFDQVKPFGFWQNEELTETWRLGVGRGREEKPGLLDQIRSKANVIHIGDRGGK